MSQAPLTLHKYPFDITDLINYKNKKSYYCLSIDPGRKNLGFGIMKISKGKNRIATVVRETMTKVDYDYYASFFNTYDYSNIDMIVIEKQLCQNTSISNISKNIISYFVCRVDAIVIEVSPRLKSTMLNCPKGTKGKNLKLWEINTALDILLESSDKRGIKIFLDECNDSDLSDFRDDVYDSTVRARLSRKYKLDDKATIIVQLIALLKWLKTGNNIGKLQKKIDLFV